MNRKIISITPKSKFYFSDEHIQASFLYSMAKALTTQTTTTESKERLKEIKASIIDFVRDNTETQSSAKEIENRLKELQGDLNSFCEANGYYDFKQLLSLAIDKDWNQAFSKDVRSVINRYHTELLPKHYQIISNDKIKLLNLPKRQKKEILAGHLVFATIKSLLNEPLEGKDKIAGVDLFLPITKGKNRDNLLVISAHLADSIYNNETIKPVLEERRLAVQDAFDKLIEKYGDTDQPDIVEMDKAIKTIEDNLGPEAAQALLEKMANAVVLADDDFIETALNFIPANALLTKTPDAIVKDINELFRQTQILTGKKDEAIAEKFAESDPSDQARIVTSLLLLDRAEFADQIIQNLESEELSKLTDQIHPSLRNKLTNIHVKVLTDEEIEERIEELQSRLEIMPLSDKVKKWIQNEIKQLSSSKNSEIDQEEDLEAANYPAGPMELDLSDLYTPEKNKQKSPTKPSRGQGQSTDNKVGESGKDKMSNLIKALEEDADKDEMKLKEDHLKKLELVTNLPFGKIKPAFNSPFDRTTIKELRMEVKEALDEIEPGHEKFKQDTINWIVSIIRNPVKMANKPLVVVGPNSFQKEKMLKKAIEIGLKHHVKLIDLEKSDAMANLNGNKDKHGDIVDALIKAQTMNPFVVYMGIPHQTGGEQDPMAMLLGGSSGSGIDFGALVDPDESKKYQDEFLPGLPLDISKINFVFCVENEKDLDGEIMDKAHIIQVDPQSKESKLSNAINNIFPTALEKAGLDVGEVVIDHDTMEYMMDNMLVSESGEYIKDTLIDLLTDIKEKLDTMDEPIVSYQITKSDVDKIIDKEGWKKFLVTIPKQPVAGQMTSLAAGDGIGIADFTQVGIRDLTGRKLVNTGKQGAMLRESNETAWTVASQIVASHQKTNNLPPAGQYTIEVKPTSWDSDGPSASALTSAVMVSAITGIPIRNDAASTGELMLTHKIGPIGGLFYKLQAAKQTGVKDVYICKANEADLKEAMKHDPGLIEPGKFEVHIIDTVEELIDNTFDWSQSDKYKSVNDLLNADKIAESENKRQGFKLVA